MGSIDLTPPSEGCPALASSRWLRSPLTALSKWMWVSALRAQVGIVALWEAAPGTPTGVIEPVNIDTRRGLACTTCRAARTALCRDGASLGFRRNVQTLLRRVSVGQAVATLGNKLSATRECLVVEGRVDEPPI